MSTNLPTKKRYRKLPRNVLSWMIVLVAIVMIGLLVYRYRQNPTGQRAARKEAKESKQVADQRPGDPERMKVNLAKAAEKAREDRAREEREKARGPTSDQRTASTESVSTPPIRPVGGEDAGESGAKRSTSRDWLRVPGIKPASDAVDRYEAAKVQLQKTVQSAQTQSTKLAAYEYDQGQDGRQGGGAGDSGTGNAQLDAMLQQLKAAQGSRPPSDTTDTGALQRLLLQQATKGQPSGQGRPDEEWLGHAAEQGERQPAIARPPHSPYLVAEGEWIPCALKWVVSTRQPGEIGCQVTRNVYDTVTGKVLLIPQYSTLFGPYNSDVANGQDSILFAFRRLRYPSGATVNLGAMSGADLRGRSGIDANVNNHFWQIYGSSFLISGVAKLLSKSDPAPTANINISAGSAVSGLSAAAGQVLVDTVKKIMERNTQIKPTAETEGAERILVYVNRDLILPPAITQVRSN